MRTRLPNSPLFSLPRTGHQGGTGVYFAGPAEDYGGRRSKGGAITRSSLLVGFRRDHDLVARSTGIRLPAGRASGAVLVIGAVQPAPMPSGSASPPPPRRPEMSGRDRCRPASSS